MTPRLPILPALALAALLSGALALPRCASAGCLVWVRFQGTASAHLEWDCTPTGADPQEMRLEAVRPDGAPAIVQSTAAAAGVPWKGKVADRGLAAGTHQWRVVERARNGALAQLYSTSADIGTRVGGTTLFDDTLADPGTAAPLDVDATVGKGTTLTLSEGLRAAGTLQVEGQVVPPRDTELKDLGLWLRAPHSLQGVNHLSLTFQAGSSGSAVDGGFDLRVTVQDAGVEIRGVSETTLYAGMGSEVMIVEDSELLELWLSSSGGGARLTKVEIRAANFADINCQGGTLVFEDCVLPTTLFTTGRDGAVVVRDSRLRGTAFLKGEGAPDFVDNQFSIGDDSGPAVSFEAGANGHFTGNVLTGPLRFGASGPPGKDVQVSGNSFVGMRALDWFGGVEPLTPVAIGANYYGDAEGPTRGGSCWFDKRFLVGGGACVVVGRNDVPVDSYFDLSGHDATGKARDDPALFPRFWFLGMALGQGTIPHGSQGATGPLRNGRDTLLSLEIRGTDERVEGVQVWVTWGGRRVDPTEPPVIVRDPATLGDDARHHAKSTIDFILPPAEGDRVHLEVFLDASGVGGFDAEPPGTVKLLESDIAVRQFLPSRQLEVALVPVHLLIPGYNPFVPALGPAMKALQQDLHAMTQVLTSEANLWATPTWHAPGLLSFFSRNILVVDLTAQLNANMALQGAASSGSAAVADILVGVTPDGSLPGGASTVCGQGTVTLAQASRGDGILHEIGHLAGMNCGANELYLKVPPHGTELTHQTAFLSEATLALGATALGDSARIVHVLYPDSPEWKVEDPWLALMGDNATPHWTLPAEDGALSGFLMAKYGSWKTPAPPAFPVLQPPPASAPVAEDRRRVFAWGRLEPSIPGTDTGWRLVPGTLRAADITALASGRQWGPGAFAHDGSEERYFLQALSPTGMVGHEEEFAVHPRSPGDASTAVPAWWATFDVPEWVDRWRIWRLSDGATVFEVPPGGGPAVRLLSPEPGAVLDGPFEVRWEGADALEGAPPGAVPFHQPVQHRVQFSRDGGATWIDAPGLMEGPSATFDPGFLQGSGQVSIRVLASDGLRSAEARVDGLSATDRAPAVALRSPRDGDRAVPGTAWRLEAAVEDPELLPVEAGAWTSSRDGPLGTGPLLAAVVLSPGDHRLTYRTRDLAGHEASASADVSVGAVEAPDLSLGPDALRVFPPGRGAFPDPEPVLVPGADHVAELRLQAPGAPVSGMLRLYLQPPSGAESLLAEQAFALPAFGRATLAAAFTAGGEGEHRFRGEVAGQSPADPDPANDGRTWTLSTQAAPWLSVDPSRPDLGSVRVGATSAPAPVTVRNEGGRGLALGTLALEGPAFRLEGDGCSGRTLAGGDSCVVTVAFAPAATGLQEGRLRIPSGDPRAPEALVALSGRGVERFRVTVFADGPGQGVVSSQPAGLACPPDCTAAFEPGTAVTLSAEAGQGSVFGGWSGACEGAGECQLVADGDRVAGARFDREVQEGPDLSPAFRTWDFGPVAVGAVSETLYLGLSNHGSQEVHVTAAGLTDPRAFAVDAGAGLPPCGPAPFAVAPGGRCVMALSFRPAAAGAQAADLVLESDDPAEPTVRVALSGRGVEGLPEGMDAWAWDAAGGDAGGGDASGTGRKKGGCSAGPGAGAPAALPGLLLLAALALARVRGARDPRPGARRGGPGRPRP